MDKTKKSPSDLYCISPDDVRSAARRIGDAAHRTPVMTCDQIDLWIGARVFFKCEMFQKVGAFKFRGAYNAIAQVVSDPSMEGRGILTHSSGNHAQAVALAAKMFGLAATIVMPTTASNTKRAAVLGYGAKVVPCEPTVEAREQTAAKIQEQTGAILIHPYNDPRIIAGQGTAALELMETVENLDVLVAPVGGGGLISGSAIIARQISPRIRIVGAEPKGADDAFRSKQAGERLPSINPQTIADGLLTGLGSLTWPIIRDGVEQIVTVDDEEIRSAQRMLWERAKLLAEPSSATALAALRRPEFPVRKESARIGVILSGGNVDLDRIEWN